MKYVVNMDDLLARVLIEIRLEFRQSLVGILLGGSAAVDDRYDDLDVCVVTNANWSQRRRKRIGGAKVDLFIENEKSLVASVVRKNRVHLIRMFANGRIVADLTGVVAHLKTRAEQVLHERPSINGDDIFRLVFEPRDMLERYARAFGTDHVLAKVLLGELVPNTLRAHRLLRGQIGLPTSELLQGADSLDAVVGRLARAVLEQPSLPPPNEVEAFVRAGLGERFDLDTHAGMRHVTS